MQVLKKTTNELISRSYQQEAAEPQQHMCNERGLQKALHHVQQRICESQTDQTPVSSCHLSLIV